jgi:hypothetical protein
LVIIVRGASGCGARCGLGVGWDLFEQVSNSLGFALAPQ